ncbi:glycosyltransferase family 2 protein [Methylobacter tundripaludum]|uniref:glycosyltransferase family 2 protein n=1 Tax=Methylobacter tundripaludum TaxID=173365 RepID=UPI000692320E|nr:glycosyltransferase [Methylobacter tundripaludum]
MIETPILAPTLTATEVEPLISVVLPIYNGEQYLAEAIDSVLSQTFANFELIMIDDGSTDDSQHILREYEKRDPRVRVVVRENRGLATTLNDAIDIARGTWIARMDQDDIALPYRFERQLEWLERTGADISGSWVQRFGSSDKRVVRLPQTDDAIKMAMLFCSPFAHPAVIMRASLVKRLGYDKRWEKAEDYDLWERAAEAGWKMANVPEVLLSYRVHAEQISTLTANRQQQLTQDIRRRYGAFVSHSMRLNQSWIDEVLKISESSLSGLDMDAVDAAFTGLLQQSHGEARDVVFDHATRLYFRAAADCPNIVSRWSKLNREFGEGFKVATKLQLWLFRLLQVRADGALFKQLKRIYIWRASR